MKGPVVLVRSNKIQDCRYAAGLFAWNEARAYLYVDEVEYKGIRGAILTYFNPPVHQVGNPGLDAYHQGLDRILEREGSLKFLILYGSNDPVHAGGDLKESLTNLDRTLEIKKAKEEADAGPEEIDRLYQWADNRLKKGIGLYKKIRQIAQSLRVVAVCGGGTRFGGSAEIPLMADVLIGDSRSGLCFSEAMIGLIPGWGGIARALIKSGIRSSTYMAKTGAEVKALQLNAMGIYDEVIPVAFPFPKREDTGNPDVDRVKYENALDDHNERTGLILLPKALDWAMGKAPEVLGLKDAERTIQVTDEAIAEEVNRRKDPCTYSLIWGKILREAREEIGRLGRPLAPQSIEALDHLFKEYDPASFDEMSFVEREMEADARLYRDPRFRAGLVGTLEQRVADYREA